NDIHSLNHLLDNSTLVIFSSHTATRHLSFHTLETKYEPLADCRTLTSARRKRLPGCHECWVLAVFRGSMTPLPDWRIRSLYVLRASPAFCQGQRPISQQPRPQAWESSEGRSSPSTGSPRSPAQSALC